MQNWINLSALWRILVIGLLSGAGLPALFALGIRALAGARQPAGVSPVDDRVVRGDTAALAGAALCFAVVLAAIGYGIYLIVSSS